METNTEATETVQQDAPPPPDQGPQFPPGTKLREYETLFLIRPELSEEGGDKLRERLRALAIRDGGKVIKFTTWGRKKTQYEIDKQNRAVYVHMHYLAPAAFVEELERNLRLSDDVIRYQTIKISDETDANRPVEEDVKLAGDVEQERPSREERGERGDRGDRGEQPEAASADTDSKTDSDDETKGDDSEESAS